MRLYFDVCCISRLTDDQSQVRVSQEAEAIETLIGLAADKANVWVGSVVLEAEISRNPDTNRRADAEELLFFVDVVVVLDGAIVSRARKLQKLGFSEFDALHLSCAERAEVDAFLTTDDRLLRRASRQAQLSVRVLNPVSFLQEVQDANSRND